MSQRESLQVDDNNGPLLAPAADESGMGEQRLLDDEQEESGNKPSTGKMLAISFVAMVFVGLGNKVFNKVGARRAAAFAARGSQLPCSRSCKPCPCRTTPCS